MNNIEQLENSFAQDMEHWGKSSQLNYHDQREILTPPLLEKTKQHKAKILEILPKHVDTFPLSYGQRALWFLSQSAPESFVYNVALTLRIHSEINIPALQGAFQEMVDRHPSLRTTFSIHNGEPFQNVHRDQEVYFKEIDVSGKNLNEINKNIMQAYKQPFNLERGPLVRMSLFSRSEKDHFLLITLHHIIFDAWSYLIFLDELQILYSAQKVGICSFLEPPGKSYTDYVQWQANMISSLEGKRLWSYWREKLAGDLQILNLPTDRQHSEREKLPKATHSFELDERLTQRVKALSCGKGKNIYITLLTAFYALLHRYTGKNDILLSSPASGRSQTEFTRTIGNFTNPVILRQDLSGDPTFKMLLTQVHQTVMDALEHQDFPFPVLVKRLQPNCDTIRSPLSQVMFNISPLGELVDVPVPGQKRSRMKWDELELEFFEIPQHEGQFDLALEMREARGSLYGTLKYSMDLFDNKTIVRMAGHFKTLLKMIVAKPDQHLSELPMLNYAKQH